MTVPAVTSLPAEPSRYTNATLADACQQLYESRGDIIGTLAVGDATEALRRAAAIERYVRTREHREAARRAQRVLELAVGAALGPAEHQGGRGHKASAAEDGLTRDTAWRFRRMVEHRELVEQCLGEGVLSRKPILERIDRQGSDDSAYTVGRDYCGVEDLQAVAGHEFGTILADPPWTYGNQSTRSNTGGVYRAGMTVEEICELPVADLAAHRSHLHLWTTNGFLFDARRVLEAWGFEYKSCFVWVKPQMGIGNYWRVSHEFLLLGVRGGLTFNDHSLKSWGQFDRREHSGKPEEIRRLIERASPGPRLELFARRTVEGWTCWGNEIRKDLFAA